MRQLLRQALRVPGEIGVPQRGSRPCRYTSSNHATTKHSLAGCSRMGVPAAICSERLRARLEPVKELVACVNDSEARFE